MKKIKVFPFGKFLFYLLVLAFGCFIGIYASYAPNPRGLLGLTGSMIALVGLAGIFYSQTKEAEEIIKMRKERNIQKESS